MTNIQELWEDLAKRGLFHMDFSLKRMEACLKYFNLAKRPVIQVLGTNGKGSTSTLLATIAKEHGLKTGLYTSPHFLSPKERIKIDLLEVSEKIWLEQANRLLDFTNDLTYFEFLTILALLIYDEQKVDLVILEAGLGGTSDATSAVFADVQVYTAIGLDHTEYLGSSLEAIALEKSGAIKEQSLVVIAKQQTGISDIIAKEAVKKKAFPYFVSDKNIYTLALLGAHQQDNARSAKLAFELFAQKNNIVIEHNLLLSAFKKAFIAGRMQKITNEFTYILDAGHNGHGLFALAQALDFERLQAKFVIFFCLTDKDIESMAENLRYIAKAAQILVPNISNNPRALPAQDLVLKLGIEASCVSSMSEALSHVKSRASVGDTVVICGSIYLLAEYYKLHPENLQNCE